MEEHRREWNHCAPQNCPCALCPTACTRLGPSSLLPREIAMEEQTCTLTGSNRGWKTDSASP